MSDIIIKSGHIETLYRSIQALARVLVDCDLPVKEWRRLVFDLEALLDLIDYLEERAE